MSKKSSSYTTHLCATQIIEGCSDLRNKQIRGGSRYNLSETLREITMWIPNIQNMQGIKVFIDVQNDYLEATLLCLSNDDEAYITNLNQSNNMRVSLNLSILSFSLSLYSYFSMLSTILLTPHNLL